MKLTSHMKIEFLQYVKSPSESLREELHISRDGWEAQFVGKEP